MKTIELGEKDLALVIREDGVIETYITESEENANKGEIYIATLGAIFSEDPKDIPGFHAMMEAQARKYFGESSNEED